MSQQNSFPIVLGGVTAVLAGGLLYWGISQRSKYAAALQEYTDASSEVQRMEGSSLYPSVENQAGKQRALKEYREDVEKLQKAFDAYRSGELPKVDPAAFGAELLKTREAVVESFKAGNTEVPAEFFLGFEAYKDSPVRQEATGILGFELTAAAELFKALAEAKPTRIDNVFRPAVEEESGKVFDAANKSYRALPLEISFTGSEESLRKFLSFVGEAKNYYVIRTLRVTNQVQKAPTAADATFESPEEAGAGATGGGDAFAGGGFVLPGEEDAGDAAAGGDAAAPEAPAAAPSDEGKILQQVLGSEKIHVFMRIDILQFLGARELPKA